MSRSEFPYDIKRRVRDKESEQPQPREDLFYDVEKNKFIKIEKTKEPLKSTYFYTTESLPGPEVEENNGLVTTDPSQDKKEEGIIEFLYDIFEDNEKTEDTLSLPNEIVPQ